MNLLKKWLPFSKKIPYAETQEEKGMFTVKKTALKELVVNRDEAIRRFAHREDLYEQALQSTASEYADVSIHR